jgi:hypothetical protein
MSFETNKQMNLFTISHTLPWQKPEKDPNLKNEKQR